MRKYPTRTSLRIDTSLQLPVKFITPCNWLWRGERVLVWRSMARIPGRAGGAGIKGAEQISGAASFAAYNGRDLSSERGLSSLHVKHNFILGYSYDLPFGPGRRWGNQ